jgi:hypothetical protein
MVRNDFLDVLVNYFNKISYIRMYWEEKVIMIMKYGIVRAIISSFRNEKYKNQIYNKMKEKEEIFNMINNRVKEWLLYDLNKNEFIDVIEKINKNFDKKQTYY